jgi:hypothetical protein
LRLQHLDNIHFWNLVHGILCFNHNQIELVIITLINSIHITKIA